MRALRRYIRDGEEPTDEFVCFDENLKTMHYKDEDGKTADWIRHNGRFSHYTEGAEIIMTRGLLKNALWNR